MCRMINRVHYGYYTATKQILDNFRDRILNLYGQGHLERMFDEVGWLAYWSVD